MNGYRWIKTRLLMAVLLLPQPLLLLGQAATPELTPIKTPAPTPAVTPTATPTPTPTLSAPTPTPTPHLEI